MRLLHWGLPEPLSALERSPRSGFETRGGLGPVDILWSVTGGVNNCQHIRSHGTHQTCKLPSAMRIYGFIDQQLQHAIKRQLYSKPFTLRKGKD